MGREIRRVPVDFHHPRTWVQRVQHRPMEGVVTRWVEERASMYDTTLAEAIAEWETEIEKFNSEGMGQEVWTQNDLDRCQRDYPNQTDDIAEIRAGLGKPKWRSAEEYCGSRPAASDGHWRPDDWPPEDERGWVVYQTVSEGTPVTPCFATAEELIDWLSTKGTEWDAPMSREAAEKFVRGGWAPSMIGVIGGEIRSGLEAHEPGGALA